MALRVYRSVGARPLDEWTVQRLDGDALRALAAEAGPAGERTESDGSIRAPRRSRASRSSRAPGDRSDGRRVSTSEHGSAAALQRRSSSATLFLVIGSTIAGAISASGWSTNRRSLNRGCGTIRSGRSTTVSPCRTRSRSSVRGALSRGRSRPRACSTASSAVNSSCGVRSVPPTAAAFKNAGWIAGDADRLGFMNGRESAIGQQRLEPGSRKGEMGSAVAQVGADGNCRRYSTHRVASTSPTRGPTCSLR